MGSNPKIRVFQIWLVPQIGHTFTKMSAERSSTGFQAIKGPDDNGLLASIIAMLMYQVSPYHCFCKGEDMDLPGT